MTDVYLSHTHRRAHVLSHLLVHSKNACEVLPQDTVHICCMVGRNPVTLAVVAAFEDLHWQEAGVRSWSQELSQTILLGDRVNVTGRPGS